MQSASQSNQINVDQKNFFNRPRFTDLAAKV